MPSVAKTALRAILLGSVLLGGCGESVPPRDGLLPALEIEPGSITVSGISAGGYMAVQFHVAYSGLVNGAGVLAAGPWYCAESSLRLALGRCTKGGDTIPADRLATLTSQLALEERIDPIRDLADDRVWIFHGKADAVVARSVVDALDVYYRTLVDPSRVVRLEHARAAHTFPVASGGSACDGTESPYLGACGYDAAGALLRHLYGDLQARGAASDGQLVAFDQVPYAEIGGSSAFAPRGWVFVPDPCTDGAPACRLHVVFHGCEQGASFVDDRFVRGAGYLEWAASNRIVLLFPQIEPGLQPLNPKGCWDWWGYEDTRYAIKEGPQMIAIRAMIAGLRGESF